MSVFIALIAEAYEEAKAEMRKAEENMLTQAPGGFGGTDDNTSARDAAILLDGLNDRCMVSDALVFSLRDALAERKEQIAAADGDLNPVAAMAGSFCQRINQTGKPASYKFTYEVSPSESRRLRNGGGAAASGPNGTTGDMGGQGAVFLQVHRSPIDIFANFSADTIAETQFHMHATDPSGDPTDGSTAGPAAAWAGNVTSPGFGDGSTSSSVARRMPDVPSAGLFSGTSAVAAPGDPVQHLLDAPRTPPAGPDAV